MASVSTYLNFSGRTEEAFEFYKIVFGSEFEGPVSRFRDIPPSPDMPPMPESILDQVMHVCLTITGGHKLMGTDAPEEMGFQLIMGNNVFLNLQPDTRAETLRLFQALSEGGVVQQELQDMFWGAYYGSCTDKYGIQWMFNCEETKQ
ncbi:MAG TPA: VOC family protein [Saprospiraceae bacterium]|jgi:PhnB protein|nr:VOC family protein [Saprospiraceae bacterium]HRG20981.1 VOC family protein [Saprospiraceae bacterium]HRG64852.1 VOC family protein [Saprospiraceae bacterium]